MAKKMSKGGYGSTPKKSNGGIIVSPAPKVKK